METVVHAIYYFIALTSWGKLYKYLLFLFRMLIQKHLRLFTLRHNIYSHLYQPNRSIFTTMSSGELFTCWPSSFRTSELTFLIGKDQTRVAAGLKAAIHNPNVSEDAKESAAQRLEHMSEGGQNGEVPTNRVLAGYKATLSSKQNLPHLVILASLLKLILILILSF